MNPTIEIDWVQNPKISQNFNNKKFIFFIISFLECLKQFLSGSKWTQNKILNPFTLLKNCFEYFKIDF